MNKSDFKILVPTDFSDQSNFALHQAIHLAEAIKANIELLYVLQEKKGIIESIFNSQRDQAFDSLIEEKLAEQSNLFSTTHKIDVSHKLIHSTSIHTAIIEYSLQTNASLIVMGKGSIYENEVELSSIGSNTSKVVRRSKIPVITIGNDGHKTGINSILLPLDLSKETRQKVSWGIKIAKLFGTKIHVISGLWDKDSEYITSKLQSQMAQVVTFIKSKNIECEGEIIESNTVKGLTPIVSEYINSHPELSLAVIMTQQEDNMTEFFIGSSATSFIREVKIPVLSVIPRELDKIVYGM